MTDHDDKLWDTMIQHLSELLETLGGLQDEIGAVKLTHRHLDERFHSALEAVMRMRVLAGVDEE
jgi:hypothetical protein